MPPPQSTSPKAPGTAVGAGVGVGVGAGGGVVVTPGNAGHADMQTNAAFIAEHGELFPAYDGLDK